MTVEVAIKSINDSRYNRPTYNYIHRAINKFINFPTLLFDVDIAFEHCDRHILNIKVCSPFLNLLPSMRHTGTPALLNIITKN